MTDYFAEAVRITRAEAWKLQSAANILDSTPSGVDGVGGLGAASGTGRAGSESAKRDGAKAIKNSDGLGAEWGIPPADSQSSPLYLLASEIVDIVERKRLEIK